MNENKITNLTDEELMNLDGGFIAASVVKNSMVTLLYAIRPNPKPIIDWIVKIFK